ncbi:MAG: hypothetical protein K2X72_03085 [Reyranella sp.]|nr:hypothetical protein [Reyranella sp.]
MRPDGTQNYCKSTFVKALGNYVIDVIVDHANRMQSPLSAVVIEYYASAVSRTAQSPVSSVDKFQARLVGFHARYTP